MLYGWPLESKYLWFWGPNIIQEVNVGEHTSGIRQEVWALHAVEASQHEEEGYRTCRSKSAEKETSSCWQSSTTEEAIGARAGQFPKAKDGIGDPDQGCHGLPAESKKGENMEEMEQVTDITEENLASVLGLSTDMANTFMELKLTSQTRKK